MRTDVEMGIKSANFSYGAMSLVGLYHTGNVSIKMTTYVEGESTRGLPITIYMAKAADMENMYNNSDVGST